MTYELPQQCHVVLPGPAAGSNIAVCVRGEQGVRITQLNFGDSVAARRIVAAFNVTLEIDADIERAMLAGCLLGWGPRGAVADGARRGVGRAVEPPGEEFERKKAQVRDLGLGLSGWMGFRTTANRRPWPGATP